MAPCEAQAMCGVRMKFETPHVEQRMAVARRLDRQHIETRTRDQSFVERLNQRGLIHQAAARGIDQQRVALHLAQRLESIILRVAGISGQCSDITSDSASTSSCGVKSRPPFRRRMVGEQHPHAERAPDGRRRLTDGAFADDAERRAVQIADRVREEAELLGPIPDARSRTSCAVRKEIAPQARVSSRTRARAPCAPRSCGCWRPRCHAPCSRRRPPRRSRSPPPRSSSDRGSCSRVGARIGTLLMMAMVAPSSRAHDLIGPRSCHTPRSRSRSAGLRTLALSDARSRNTTR